LALVAVLLIGAIVWVFFIRDKGKKPVASIDGKPNTSQQGTNNETQPGSSNQPAGGGAQAQGDNKPAATTPNGATQPTTLANAGPGNLAAVFAGATTVGGLAHHLHIRKKRR
ncbi:MAG: hypothetical protein ABWX94_01060, partial [Candidatus Saccharimonadales bacterium]